MPVSVFSEAVAVAEEVAAMEGTVVPVDLATVSLQLDQITDLLEASLA